MTNLYHADVNLPNQFKFPVFEGRLSYSRHARQAAQDDRFGKIELPLMFFAANARCIEVEVNPAARNRVLKQVWRIHLDAYRDLVLVIVPGGFVKTVWSNKKEDKHKTLNSSNYVRA